MGKSTTYTLYVNLSASKVRKRLKGYGFGVRDVQAADRNQSLIIHTATGDHLRDLQSLFSDVASSTQNDLGTPLENLPGFGPTSAMWLREVGVHSLADLKSLGPELAYHLVKQKQPRTSLNLLWSIAAAVLGKEPDDLTSAEKSKFRASVKE